MSARMDTWKLTLLVLFITTWFSVTWETHATLKCPVQSIILIILLSGACLILATKFPILARDAPLPGLKRDDRDENSTLRYSLDQHTRMWLVKNVALCIVIRAGSLWVITTDIQCSKRSLEQIVFPFLIFLCSVVRYPKQQDNDHDVDDMSRTIYSDFYHTFSRSLTPQFLPTILLSIGTYQTSKHTLPSTYIRSGAIGSSKFVLFCQIASVFLDCNIVVSTWRLLKDSSDERQRLRTLGIILISTAFVLIICGAFTGMFMWGGIEFVHCLSKGYLGSVVRDAFAFAMLLFCVARLSSQTHLTSLINKVTFCCVSTPLFLSAWASRGSFPPQSNSAKSIGVLFLFMGLYLSVTINSRSKRVKTSAEFPNNVVAFVTIFLAILFVVIEVFFLMRSNEIRHHPIYTLMYEARIQGDRWLTHASSSESLIRAVIEYRERHGGRDPPPNFDKWYEFALKKGASVIDNYDSIDQDLLPFWAMTPSDIRSSTIDGWDEVVLVDIRNGTVSSTVDQNLEVTKITEMINEFAAWLPDLQIAVNTQLLPRISLPWKGIESMKKTGSYRMSKMQPLSKNQGFTHSTDGIWPSTKSGRAITSPKKSKLLSTSIFDETIASGCPLLSQTRRNRGWNPQDFCSTCASPHSEGQFLKNWTIAADICHQPDLANIHSLFTEERTELHEKPVHGILIPIFSPTKVTAFHDILFPFPGTYVDINTAKVSGKSFAEMQDKVLWRNSLFDGASFNYKWQGMQQQRLVHTANNLDTTKSISMLVPSSNEGKFVYENVLAAELEPMVEKFNVAFSEFCTKGNSCNEQRREFEKIPDPFSEKSTAVYKDAHSNYRYVFTIDNDRGPDPDFLRWLSSNSAPFHASIFRHWYDDRLTPWLHFIPQDMRLHAVYSTLAYYSGFKGRLNGKNVQMNAKPEEAAFIADQGRKWSLKALRKEDASVYAFRLLLEYGRLTDDRRDEIGYVVGAEDGNTIKSKRRIL